MIPDTGECETRRSPVITDVPKSTDRQDMMGPSGTQRSGDTENSEEPPDTTEIPGSTEGADGASIQDMVGPSSTQRPIKSGDTENSEQPPYTTEIPGSTEGADGESTQDMVGPSGTQRSKRSRDTENSENSPDTTEIPGSPDGALTRDMVGLYGTPSTKISAETQTEPDMGTTREMRTVETQADGETVPLNSQTGAVVPAQSFSQSWSLWQFWPFSCFGESKTQQPAALGTSLEPPESPGEEEPGTSVNNDDAVDGKEEGFVHIDPREASDGHAVIEGKSFQENIDQIRAIIDSTYPTYLCYFPSLRSSNTVGIFSRSSESEYKWLIKQLKSKPFHNRVSTVQPHYIANNGVRQFMDAVSQCTFGILYHTKNRGRINIINVTDSLYDDELPYMSEHLGKNNVIVVVDDLEDTSDKERKRILNSQPSIGRLAKDILLFSAADNRNVTTGEIQEI